MGAKRREKFPAVLEYHPYRKDDGTAERDYSLYSYFVRRGYICARVDIRGFGSCEGIPTDRGVLWSRNNSMACRSSPGWRISRGRTAAWE